MKRFLKSFAYALAGIGLALKSERNLRVHLAAAVVAVALGIYLRLPVVEWGLVILAIGFVLAAELFNTAIERTGDHLTSGKKMRPVKNIKDISAGAVFVSALAALAIGIMVIIVPLVQKIAGTR